MQKGNSLGKKKVHDITMQRTKVHDPYNIYPGCMFWDITDDIPIGSKALRAPDKGAVVTDTSILSPTWHGCNRIGIWRGKRIAFTTEYTGEHYNDK